MTKPAKQPAIHYVAEGNENAPVIVLINGLGGDLRQWQALRLMLQSQYRVVSLDNRDSGHSERGDEQYYIEDMANDVVDLLDRLAIGKTHVIGYSMGGAIAQELAINQPQLVDKLILLATYDSTDNRAQDLFRGFASLRRDLNREDYLRLTLPWGYTYEEYEKPGFVEEVIAELVNDPLYQENEAFTRQMEATIAFNSRDRLHLIKAPTLLVFGDEDIMTPIRFANSMVARIKNAQLFVIKGTGHLFMRTRFREASEVIKDFLDE
ncbi:MAG: alpha/beta fold hydrolase [SAR202 cluster bacterium]|nr:alpha/beta fold hydrolase [SAR202 cluster bacterium]|tara:strand:+ start:17666 stop:18460 length:795 start_codon:yes stop_codon:yes gene_type:complete